MDVIMSKKSELDEQTAHRHFSVECFNRAWDLIDKPDRTREEDEEMIRLSLASAWHWSQRPDCTPKNFSISYWQTSRVYALLRQPDNARRYGQLCLDVSQGDDIPPFYLAYAYEALARAEAVAGNREKAEAYIAEAQKTAERIDKPEDQQQLFDDLAAVGKL
jgi:hypothetical protein